MWKKLTIGLVALAAVFPASAFAQTAPDVRHAYQPTMVHNTGWMNARVNNVVMNPNDRLVCVEAFPTTGAAKTHLGCLDVHWGQANHWSQEFNAPTNWLGSGTYNVKYTYRAGDGTWHDVTDMSGNTMSGTVTK